MTLRRLVGIPLPIIQAPLAGVQGSALAVAVSNAGGLGSLPCAMLGPDGMRDELAAIRAQTTKPFNVAGRALAVLHRIRHRPRHHSHWAWPIALQS